MIGSEAAAIILTAILGAIFALIGWLLARLIRGVDANVKATADNVSKLWESHDKLAERFHRLEGQHEINHKLKISVEKT